MMDYLRLLTGNIIGLLATAFSCLLLVLLLLKRCSTVSSLIFLISQLLIPNADMQEVASQLILKWARFGEERKIDVAADFTRFTFDTIALYVKCAIEFFALC